MSGLRVMTGNVFRHSDEELRQQLKINSVAVVIRRDCDRLRKHGHVHCSDEGW